jgi:predicted ArsR family transcriptional regulator
VLDALREASSALTLAALSGATGLHPNTLRDHLDALERGGLVRRRRAAPSGRGRPAWLYAAVEQPHEASPYAGLTATLAAALLRTSTAASDEAVRAGTEWGHDIARSRPAAGPPDAQRQVTGLLADFGFAPEPADVPGALRLTRCPLLEAARAHPDVVCGVHLGIVRGALAEYGDDSAAAALFPFSDPGWCRLELDQAGR